VQEGEVLDLFVQTLKKRFPDEIEKIMLFGPVAGVTAEMIQMWIF